MNERERSQLRALIEQLERVLRGDLSASPSPVTYCPEIALLSDLIMKLTRQLSDAKDFVSALSRGKLDAAPPPRNHLVAPFKQLQANLRHLTWQTQQIAAGDLNQRVDFLGEFSVAFNSLIDALREKAAVEAKVLYLSHHDPLTDLYNRGYFEEEMARAERGRRFPVSIMVADLDGLKKTNDTLGHAVGDRLIRAAAEVIRRSVRAEDVVARIGGDEFAVILPDTGMTATAGVLVRLRENEAWFNRESEEFQVHMSVGFASVEEGGLPARGHEAGGREDVPGQVRPEGAQQPGKRLG